MRYKVEELAWVITYIADSLHRVLKAVVIIEEVSAIDEETRSTTAAGSAKQCAWSCWKEAEQRKLSWHTLAQMEPLRISFLLRSTYDLLPTPTNLKQWGIIDDDICRACNQTRARAYVNG